MSRNSLKYLGISRFVSDSLEISVWRIFPVLQGGVIVLAISLYSRGFSLQQGFSLQRRLGGGFVLILLGRLKETPVFGEQTCVSSASWEAPVDRRVVCPGHVEAPSLTSKLVSAIVPELPSQPPNYQKCDVLGYHGCHSPYCDCQWVQKKCKQQLLGWSRKSSFRV